MIDAARRAQIDIFHARALAQRGEYEARREPFCIALGGFSINQQPDALFEGQSIENLRSRRSSNALAIPDKSSVISRFAVP